jgi:hypothetical protein
VDRAGYILKWPYRMNRPQAFLVVGANPLEDRHGREFYDDSRYYLLDRASSSSAASRYFQQDFLDVDGMTELARRYPKKFDYIFFDFSVCKFFEGNVRTLAQFMLMLKEGGKLVLDDVLVYSTVPYERFGTKTTFENQQNYVKHKHDTVQRALNAARSEFRALPSVRSVEIVSYDTILDVTSTDPFQVAARPIYTQWSDLRLLPPQCIVITKTTVEENRNASAKRARVQTSQGVFMKGGRRTRRRKLRSLT